MAVEAPVVVPGSVSSLALAVWLATGLTGVELLEAFCAAAASASMVPVASLLVASVLAESPEFLLASLRVLVLALLVVLELAAVVCAAELSCGASLLALCFATEACATFWLGLLLLSSSVAVALLAAAAS